MSDPFHKVHETVFAKIHFRPTAAELFSHFRTSGGVYSDFVTLLGKDPEPEGFLLQVVQKITEGKTPEPVTSAKAAMAFLGFANARNLIAAYVLRGNAEGLVPGSPELESALRFSLMGEKQAGEDALGAQYFVGGLAYDALLAALKPEDPTPLSDAWMRGRQAGLIAAALARELAPSNRFEGDLILDGLLHATGSAIHAYQPSAVPAPQLAYLLASRLGFAAESAWVALYQDLPVLAARKGRALRVRATLIWLAVRMARYKAMAGDLNYGPKRLEAWRTVLNHALEGSKIAEPVEAEKFPPLLKGVSV